MTGKICIIGLGYVGLPLACLAASRMYMVRGLEKDAEKAAMINRGESPIKDDDIRDRLRKVKVRISVTTNPSEAIPQSDVIVICVPTPIDCNFEPDLAYVRDAAKAVASHLRKGHLVILESTVSPGTTAEVVKPILESSGLVCGRDFLLAHCPERVDPGNLKWKIEKIPRVIGMACDEGLEKAVGFYKSVIDAQIFETSSSKVAEMVKLAENSFRDINIAFVNELAKSCDKLGIDVTEVIKGASTKPFGYMPFYAGCGVGGHCIPLNPYYLMSGARKAGFEHEFLKLARKINDSMPAYTVQKAADALSELSMDIRHVKVSVLGLSYKGGIDDVRESPALKILDILKEMGVKHSSYDPYIPSLSSAKSMDEALQGAACVIVATDHREFRGLDPSALKKHGVLVVIDGRNALDKKGIISKGIIYRGIGR